MNDFVIEDTLKKFRIKRGLTVSELARKLGCNHNDISRHERKERFCPFPRQVNILDALDVELTIRNKELIFKDLKEDITMTSKTNFSEEFVIFNEKIFEDNLINSIGEERIENEERFNKVMEKLAEEGFYVEDKLSPLTSTLDFADEYAACDLARLWKDRQHPGGPRMVLYTGGSPLYEIFNLEKFIDAFDDVEGGFIKKAIFYHFSTGLEGKYIYDAFHEKSAKGIASKMPYLSGKVDKIVSVLESDSFFYTNENPNVLPEDESVAYRMGIYDNLSCNHIYYMFEFEQGDATYEESVETHSVIEALSMAGDYFEDMEDKYMELLEGIGEDSDDEYNNEYYKKYIATTHGDVSQ